MTKNIGFWVVSLLAITLLGGCVKTVKMVGYSFEDKKIEQLERGKTRKAVVKRELGSPSVISTYGGETWYYISTEYEGVAFLKPKIKSQKVLEIKFGNGEAIKEIKQYSEVDAREIEISSDTTKTEGHDVGVLGQLLGNVGKYNNNKRDVAKPRTSQP